MSLFDSDLNPLLSKSCFALAGVVWIHLKTHGDWWYHPGRQVSDPREQIVIGKRGMRVWIRMLAAHLFCLLLANDVASTPSYRRTVVQSQVTPTLVEGDISVPQSHLGTGEPLSAFLTQPSALWPRGLVSYRIETFEWEGKVEPIFSDEGVANITRALGQIMRDVPCIKFR